LEGDPFGGARAAGGGVEARGLGYEHVFGYGGEKVGDERGVRSTRTSGARSTPAISVVRALAHELHQHWLTGRARPPTPVSALEWRVAAIWQVAGGLGL
jgi:hypothetical protein